MHAVQRQALATFLALACLCTASQGARQLPQADAAAAAPAATLASLLGPAEPSAGAAGGAPAESSLPVAQLSSAAAGGAPAPAAVAVAGAPAMQPPAAPVAAPQPALAVAAVATAPAGAAMSPTQPGGAPLGAPEAPVSSAAALAAAAGPGAGGALVSVPEAALAPAPSGAAASKRADIQDTLGAKAGAFTDATTLFLAGLDRSVLWSIEADAGRRTGRFPTADFMGAGFNDARGDWLSQPQAVLHATTEGSKRSSTWALQLSQPRFHAGNATLTFTVKVLSDSAAVRHPGGAVAYALADGDHSLVTEVDPDVLLRDPVLFIDDSTTAQQTATQAAVSENDGNADGEKASFLPLPGLAPPSGQDKAALSGALVNQTPVSTSASVVSGGGGGGGLINAGGSGAVYMRSAWCPNLGWVYRADPYACGEVWG